MLFSARNIRTVVQVLLLILNILFYKMLSLNPEQDHVFEDKNALLTSLSCVLDNIIIQTYKDKSLKSAISRYHLQAMNQRFKSSPIWHYKRLKYLLQVVQNSLPMIQSFLKQAIDDENFCLQFKFKAFYYQGYICLNSQRYVQAKLNLIEALKIKQHHRKANRFLIETFDSLLEVNQAYQYLQLYCKQFPQCGWGAHQHNVYEDLMKIQLNPCKPFLYRSSVAINNPNLISSFIKNQNYGSIIGQELQEDDYLRRDISEVEVECRKLLGETYVLHYYQCLGLAEQTYNYAMKYRDAKYLQIAKKNLIRCIELDSYFEQGYIQFGNNYMDQGNMQFAQVQYRKALDLNSKSYNANFNIAFVCQHDKQRLNEAIQYYKAAIECKPHRFEVYYQLAKVYKKCKNFEQAQINFHKSLNIKKNQFKAYYHLAQVKQQKKHYQQAFELYQVAIQQGPAFLDSHRALSQLKMVFKDFLGALQILKDFVTKNPRDEKGYIQIAQLFASNGMMQEAKKYFWDSIHINPTPYGFHRLGQLSLLDKDSITAQDYFMRAIKLDDKYVGSRYGLVIAYSMSNRYNQALAQINRCIKADPSCQKYKESQAYIRECMEKQSASMQPSFQTSHQLLSQSDITVIDKFHNDYNYQGHVEEQGKLQYPDFDVIKFMNNNNQNQTFSSDQGLEKIKEISESVISQQYHGETMSSEQTEIQCL